MIQYFDDHPAARLCHGRLIASLLRLTFPAPVPPLCATRRPPPPWAAPRITAQRLPGINQPRGPDLSPTSLENMREACGAFMQTVRAAQARVVYSRDPLDDPVVASPFHHPGPP